MTVRKVYKRYSESFKRQVVAEYEDGATAFDLCRKYGIGSVRSVTMWVKQYSREGLRHEVVHIQTPDEADQLRCLEQERDVLRQSGSRAKPIIRNGNAERGKQRATRESSVWCG